MKVALHQLSVSYNERAVLNVDHLEIESGSITALLGPNGSGKSTLLGTLAGQVRPDGKFPLYDGAPALPKDQIAYMPQNPYLFDLTVLGNVRLGVKERNESSAAFEALKSVRMEDYAGIKTRTLSGGEAQRVALARTLVLHKRLILLDEPASAIDISSMKLVEDYIRDVNRKIGSTIVFSTHNPSQAFRTADYVCFLWEGNVIEKGPAREVLKHPDDERAKAFLENWRL